MERHAVYSGTRNLYADMATAAKSLAANSHVTDIWLLIEDDALPYELPDGPVRFHTMDMSGQTYFDPNGPNMRSVFTYMAIIRAAYAEIFPDIDRIVSFDCDAVCVDNVDYLWEVDLQGNLWAANLEYLGTHKPYGPRYWNVGVCVYDLAAIRAEDMTRRLVDMIETTKLWCVEQDAIASTQRVLTLPERYNESAVTGYTDDPAVVHFASFGTGWRDNNRVPRREYWRKYENMEWDEVMACRAC